MKKIKLSKLIKQLNATHEPPGGWRASDDLKIKKALKDGAYKRWKKLLNQKLQANKPTSCQAQSLQDLDPTIDWNKFLKELTS